LPKTQDKPQAKPANTATSAAGNRFAERFSPPRPPQRTLPEPIEPIRPAFKADPKLVNAWKTKAGRDLTEPELLAMPEAEYMNEKQLEFFRARLQALKDDLLSNAGETTEHLREDTSIVPDPADRATIEEEHALELRTRDRERKLLKKISQSLARIEAGDYGYCDETGEPIGLGRLLARPTATLSLEAQQRREMKQKMFGD
jgi:DnaK suppressor protein